MGKNNTIANALSGKNKLKEKSLSDKSERAGEALTKIHKQSLTTGKVKSTEKSIATSFSLTASCLEDFELAAFKIKSNAKKLGIKGINKTSIVEKLISTLVEDFKKDGMKSAIVQKIINS